MFVFRFAVITKKKCKRSRFIAAIIYQQKNNKNNNRKIEYKKCLAVHELPSQGIIRKRICLNDSY